MPYRGFARSWHHLHGRPDALKRHYRQGPPKKNGFRHFFNAYMSGAALAPVLERPGKDRRAYHLTADYTWGWTQQEIDCERRPEAVGWETVNNVLTPLATTDFSSYIAPV
ncbi:MAG: hypothetical protein R3D32_00350 [Nitratireductor sp.]